MKRNPVILLALIYFALMLICVCIIMLMLSSCNPTKQMEKQSNNITIIWDADCDSAFIEYYNSGNWHIQSMVAQSGKISVRQQSNLYRMIALKDADTAYSKVIYVK